MQYKILDPKIASNTRNFSFWQSPIWQNILVLSHQAREVFYFWDDISCILIEIRSVWLGQFGAFSLWVRPDQFQDKDNLFFQELFAILREKKCIFFQLESLFEDIFPEFGEKWWKVYKKFLTPHTRILDISETQEDILGQMHEKWRYNIRLAEKRWVTIQSVEPTSENMDIWMSLIEDTTTRDSFSHNSRKYYEIFIRELLLNNSWELLFAYYEGIVIAAIVVVYSKDSAIYYYGASMSDKNMRKHMAPYLLQWYALCEAKKRGIALYDFLGVRDPHDPHDPLLWVTDFKEKFWWIEKKLGNKHIVPLSLIGKLFLLLRNIKKK